MDEKSDHSSQKDINVSEIYVNETQVLIKAQEIYRQKTLSAQKLWEEYGHLLHHYQKLLTGTKKITRIGDRYQKKTILQKNHLAKTLEELKSTQERLEVARKKAEAASKAKSSFLTNISHELRTPLNTILGFVQIMNQSDNLTGEQQENLEIIYRSGEHLLTLINQILNLSKIEAGHIQLDKNHFDLHYLLSDLKDAFYLQAQAKGLRLLFEYSKDIPQYIYADEVKLKQILLNLLSNALKFTTEGTIALKIIKSQKESPPNAVYIQFEVQDTGPGIKAEEVDELFQDFVQTEVGRQTGEGTGLGLSISRKFVQLMQGDIAVDSEVNKGAKFIFDILVEITPPASIESDTSEIMGLEHDPSEYGIHDEFYTIELLNTLTDECLAQLKQGAEEADFCRLCEVIEKIHEVDSTLADSLSNLVEQFQYNTLLTLLHAARE